VTSIRIIQGDKKIYLTFDDGPSAESTLSVLKVLKDEGVVATFFLVAEKARANPELLQEIITNGHSIGNHSLDHSYRAFFGSKKTMSAWIQASEDVFSKLGIQSVGFRPPAGVVTPPLIQALKDRKEPLVRWNIRFFDTVIPWTKSRALAALAQTQGGSIVLLHDAQSSRRIENFCLTLESYIRAARLKGFEFGSLTAELCRKQSSN
jgi:peptidoglycan/xylan/chitin deacetylase (PgdA/CDA1 family)